jgi:hypothetical protein
MKIFISWSGARSHAVAEHMSGWIKCVLQASDPWLSSRDIDRGAIWFSEINEQLSSTSAGIVCLTQENKNKPWILFETGALAKGITSNRVCTFLVDLQPADLQDPLAQFNHTLPERASMWGLVRSLNGLLMDRKLDERILLTVFETYWQQFIDGMNNALTNFPELEQPEPRADADILIEILSTTRSLSHRVREMETRGAPQRVETGGPTLKQKIGKVTLDEAINLVVEGLLKGEKADTVFDTLTLVYDVESKIAGQIIDSAQKRLRDAGQET